jgi:hypothetical protein
MTAAEKLEQLLSGRPSSFVPAHTLERLLGMPHKPDQQRVLLNWGMHRGHGIVLGAGSPPWTWPVYEQAIDLLHKAVYAFVTGLAADRLVAIDAPIARTLRGRP